MTITDIYDKYRINKGLREHQIRVATVAKVASERSSVDLPTRHIVDGSLVHDMGNLIKSKLDRFHEFFEPEGVEYWQQVKDEMIAQYGESEDVAARAIVADMRLADESLTYFNAFGFEVYERVCAEGTLGEKIAQYADMRVGPYGIITLKDRFDDIRERYAAQDGEEGINHREALMQTIEAEIFETCDIDPDDITDESTRDEQAALLRWELALK